jgi:hypothetical protein
MMRRGRIGMSFEEGGSEGGKERKHEEIEWLEQQHKGNEKKACVHRLFFFEGCVVDTHEK